MTGHPVVAGWPGPGADAAVDFATVVAAVLRRPLLLAPVDDRELDDSAADVLERTVAPAVPGPVGDAAQEHDAALIVIGRENARRAGPDLLAQVHCPVAVVPATERSQGPIRMIGVALDGSARGGRAVAAAMHLAVETGASVRVLSVTAEGAPPDVEADRAAADLGDAVPATAVHLHGVPAECLANAGRELDVLICASHGRGRLAARLLGSTTWALVTTAPCPVLVVPPHAWHRVGRPLGLSTAGD